MRLWRRVSPHFSSKQHNIAFQVGVLTSGTTVCKLLFQALKTKVFFASSGLVTPPRVCPRSLTQVTVHQDKSQYRSSYAAPDSTENCLFLVCDQYTLLLKPAQWSASRTKYVVVVYCKETFRIIPCSFWFGFNQIKHLTSQLQTLSRTRRKYTNACDTSRLHSHKMLHLWRLSWAGRLKM